MSINTALLILFILTTITTVIYTELNKYKFDDIPILANILLSIVINFLAYGFIIFIFTLVTPKVETKTNWYMNPEMMSDRYFIMGSFTMGSGEIKEEFKYNAYVKHNDGSIHIHTFSANNTVLRYTTGKPSIKIEDIDIRSKWWNELLIDSEQKITIYIPEGTFKPTNFDGQ